MGGAPNVTLYPEQELTGKILEGRSPFTILWAVAS
jgi:hypothetical protein